jgi:hypothetical protein
MAEPTNPTTTPAKKVVSQEKLRRYLELTTLMYELNDLREQLLTAFDAGAIAEDGDLVAHFFVDFKAPFTGKKVCEALGLTWRQVQELRHTVSMSRYRRLRVYPCSSPAAQSVLAR